MFFICLLICNTFWWVGIVSEVNVMKMIWRSDIFTHIDLGKLSAFHLLLINVLSQHQTFYVLSQLQQQSLGKCIGSQTLILNKLLKHMKIIKCSQVYIKLYYIKVIFVSRTKWVFFLNFWLHIRSYLGWHWN